MYRIGELAQITQVSKRTIDYYTNLGLLQPSRSDSNYRYFDETACNELQYIEQYKKLNMPLAHIKLLLEQKRNPVYEDSSVGEQLDEASFHIHQLEKELLELHSLVDGLPENERNVMMKHISGKAVMLINSLTLFLR